MNLKYKLNDRPKPGHLLLYGLQWWVIALPCMVIMGAVVARMHYESFSEQIFYMRRLFMVMGAATVVQVLWGHRLPLVMGPAATLLVGLVATVSSGVNAIYTAILLGGATIFILAISGLLSKLRFFFTRRIVAVILILIAFTLGPTILQLIFPGGRHTAHLAFALLFVFALVLCNTMLRGVWKSLTVVIGMFAGSFIYFAIFGFPGLSKAGAAKSPGFFISALEFDAGAIISFMFCFLALLINELGSIESVGQMLKADNMAGRIKRGAAMNGLANIASGAFGVIGPVDFSLSAGVISATGCASRYTLVPAGLALLACASIPGVIELLSAIPGPVLGAIMLYLMASQLSSGLTMLVEGQGVSDFNSGIIVSLPLMLGIIISFAPPDVFSGLGPMLGPLLGNGFVVGTVAVIILEHIVFRNKLR